MQMIHVLKKIPKNHTLTVLWRPISLRAFSLLYTHKNQFSSALVHFSRSQAVIIPNKADACLGFVISSANMSLFLTDEKKAKKKRKALKRYMIL